MSHDFTLQTTYNPCFTCDKAQLTSDFKTLSLQYSDFLRTNPWTRLTVYLELTHVQTDTFNVHIESPSNAREGNFYSHQLYSGLEGGGCIPRVYNELRHPIEERIEITALPHQQPAVKQHHCYVTHGREVCVINFFCSVHILWNVEHSILIDSFDIDFEFFRLQLIPPVFEIVGPSEWDDGLIRLRGLQCQISIKLAVTYKI